MKFVEDLSKCLGIFVVICTLIAATFGAFTIFATNEDVQLVAERLDQKILTDRLNAIQNLIWKYDDRYGEGCERCSGETLETYRKMLQDKAEIERQLEVLKEKG